MNYKYILPLLLLLAAPGRAAQADLAQFDGGAETELALRQLLGGVAASTGLPPAALAAPSAPVAAWAQEAAPELRLRRFEAAPAYGVKYLNVAELDPAKFLVKSASARKLLGKNLATVPEFAAAVPGALAIVNASFFNTVSTSIPETPLFEGYFVEDGELAPYSGKQKRVFYVTREGAPGVALQAEIPPLATLYSAVAGYGAGSKIDSTARTAVCLTAEGGLKLIGAYPVRTLDLMTEFLKTAEGCAGYVHLDGGGSAQFFYRNGAERLNVGWNRYDECYAGDTAMPAKCYRRVASVVMVLPRPATGQPAALDRR